MSMGVGCIMFAGPIRVIIIEGREYRFEMNENFGPFLVGKTDDPLAKQPGGRHKFWEGFRPWWKQGKRLHGDYCIWDYEPEPIVQHLGGKHWLVTGYSDPRPGWHPTP